MIKCPRCKSSGESISLRELWIDHCLDFDQRRDGKIEAEGYVREGAPYEVRGCCLDCDHQWKLRGVRQISDLPQWLGRE